MTIFLKTFAFRATGEPNTGRQLRRQIFLARPKPPYTLSAVHARARADERASGEHRVEDVRATLLTWLDDAGRKRDGLRAELDSARDALRDALTPRRSPTIFERSIVD